MQFGGATDGDLSKLIDFDPFISGTADVTSLHRVSRDLTVGKVAKSAVGSLIPFRGIIREVSGAADRQRDFQEAILAGAIRRGFLKGLGDARECPYPARPAFMKIAIDRDDEVAYDDDANTEAVTTPDPNNPF